MDPSRAPSDPPPAKPASANQLGRLAEYVVAVAAAVVTLLLRLPLTSWIGDEAVLVLFIVPIIVSAYLGGFGPGLACTAVVGLGTALYGSDLGHRLSLDQPGTVARWLILMFAGVLVSVLSEELHRARRHESVDRLDRRDLSLHRKIQGGFALALAALGIVGVASYLAVVQLRRDAGRVEHTRDVVGRLNALFADTIDAQNGYRGYVVDNADLYLEPYHRALQSVPVELQRLRQLTADNPAQTQRLDQLDPLLDALFAHSRRVIEARRSQGIVAAQELMRTRRGKRLHEQIQQLVEAMKGAEESLLQTRKARVEQTAFAAQAVIVTGSVVAIGFVGLALFSIRRDFSARRRAEDALRQSEENLAVTLHSIGDAVLATDTVARVTRMNRVAEQLTGWTQAEAAGRPVGEIFRIINEETRAPALIPVNDVLATGEIHGLANHTVLIARDGTERAIADSAAPIRDRDHALRGVVLVFRDITLEQAAERALRKSEAQYRTLFTSIDEGFCIIEMIFDERDRPIDYRFLEINPSFEKHTGLHDAVGKRMRELAPLHEAHWFEIYGRIALTGEPARFQNRAEQLHRTYDVYAFRFGDPKDRQVAILFSDISERQRAEEERDRFFTLSVDFLCIASADGYFKRVSPAVTDMLGWSVPEFLARPLIEFVHPEDRAATLGAIERQIQAGEKVLQFENRYLHKDGSWRLLSWRSVPYAGGLMYATARDVTEDHARNEQIRDLNARLGERAALLEAANRELESFSYSVSHDLRAPLRHVQGYVAMLTREAEAHLSDKAKHYLKTIADAGREMGELIDDLLSFSKMGRAEMRTSSVDPHRLIDAVRRDLELASRDRNIRWKVCPLPPVQGDPAMLRQVFVNLLGNAVKYTRGRDPAEIEVGHAGEEHGRIVLYVRDNGAGFDMKYSDKLFGVFQRLHRSDEFEGTGIGLANVRRIITRHGGRTWAAGVPNAGATFYLTLAPVATPLPPPTPPS